MSKKKLNFLTALVCDRVVSGGGNKHTLINVYSGNIIVSDEFPVRLFLGFYFEFLTPDSGPYEYELDFLFDGKSHGEVRAAGVGIADTPGVLVIPMMELGIDADITLEIVAKAKGLAKTSVLKKRIYRGEIPTAPSASTPPSAQSPAAAAALKKQP